jgi:hypothetical protein
MVRALKPVKMKTPLQQLASARAKANLERSKALQSKLMYLGTQKLGLGDGFTEYPFSTTRDWRFDVAWPSRKIAVEIEGGVWSGGRHTRGAGFLADMEKYNAAVCLGWSVLRFTPDQVSSGAAEPALQVLRAFGW